MTIGTLEQMLQNMEGLPSGGYSVAGLSVSRVGGAAQTKIVKRFVGDMRISLAQFRELEAFAQFASDLDEATRKQLERGQRTTEILKQHQYAPLSVAEMVVSLFIANQGSLADVPLDKVVAFEKDLLIFMRTHYKPLLDKINQEKAYSDEIGTALTAAVAEFKQKYVLN